MLIDFISDYLRQPNLRKRFSAGPLEILDEYGITPAQRSALRSRDRDAIFAAVSDEMSQIWEQAHGAKAGEIGPLGWGVIGIEVSRVQPSGAEVGVPTQVKITGSGFPAADSAVLTFATGGIEVTAKVISVIAQANGDSVLEGEVLFEETGTYTVTVSNKDYTNSGSWDGGFIVKDKSDSDRTGRGNKQQ